MAEHLTHLPWNLLSAKGDLSSLKIRLTLFSTSRRDPVHKSDLYQLWLNSQGRYTENLNSSQKLLVFQLQWTKEPKLSSHFLFLYAKLIFIMYFTSVKVLVINVWKEGHRTKWFFAAELSDLEAYLSAKGLFLQNVIPVSWDGPSFSIGYESSDIFLLSRVCKKVWTRSFYHLSCLMKGKMLTPFLKNAARCYYRGGDWRTARLVTTLWKTRWVEIPAGVQRKLSPDMAGIA